MLDFQKFVILTAHTLRGAKMRHHAKFCADRSVWPLRRYGRFRFFKMAAVRHLGFLKVGNFNCPHPSGGQNASSCQIMCKSVQALRRYRRFRFFQDGDRPPSWICYTPVWTTYEVYFGGHCHCAKFGLNRCSSFDNMEVLIF